MTISRESERHVSDMLANVQLAAVMLDREARITYCNEYLLRMTGWRIEEVLGRNWFETFMPAALGDMKPAFAALLANLPEAWNVENEIHTRAGERRLIRWNNSVLRSETGEVIGVASIGEDITERVRVAEELRRSESVKSAILESSLDCVVTIGADGRIVEFNPAASATFGFTREQALGAVMIDLIVPPRMREAHRAGFERYLATGEGRILGKRLELAAIRRDGGEFPVELTIIACGTAGTPLFTAFIRDITARKEADDGLRRLNRVHAVLSQVNSLIVRVQDRGELFREASRIAVEQGGFIVAWIGVVDREAGVVEPLASSGDVRDFFDGIPMGVDEDAGAGVGLVGRAVRDMKPMVSNDLRSDPRKLLRKGTRERGILSIVVIPLIVGEEAIGVFALYSAEAGFFDDAEMRLLLELAGNISFAIDNIAQHERLDYLAYYDVLTGLANRGLFLERVAQYMREALRDGHKFALYFIDLERFRNINDTLGQGAGDTLLRQVAQWLTLAVGEANPLARVGPDHFAAVLPDVGQEGEVARFLEKTMLALLEHPFKVGDAVLRIGARIGVAVFPGDGASADALFKNAEAAVRRSKRQGERIVFYAAEMNARASEALAIETRLRRAIERREFVLHYQPKFALASGRITGAEALIRWQDPENGLIAPGSFIPVLEETGMIVEVGRWVVEQAFADLRAWSALGYGIARVAVNVSAVQLQRRGFVDDLMEDIWREGDRPEGLELELTESLVMNNVQESIRKLSVVRDVGVKISIDDFGTGYSSLSYLGRLPLDSLKIDRSFISGLTSARESASIVSTIIDLAHGLGLLVVAEGVETREQAEALKWLKCDEAQGFLFGRPGPRAEFEKQYLDSRVSA